MFGSVKLIISKFKNLNFFDNLFSVLNSIESYEHLNFEKKSHKERIKIVKQFHNPIHKHKTLEKLNFRDIKKLGDDANINIKIVSDIIVGYSKILKPKSFLQLGTWYLGEIGVLKISGYKGKLIASDFSVEHLKSLEKKTKGTVLKDVKFRKIDIENCSLPDFNEIEMMSAVQVLSNIQPEGIKKFFSILKNSKIKIFVICDVYSAKSQRHQKSYKLKKLFNWCHPYKTLAEKNGFKSFMIPDFTFDTYSESRAIFIIYKNINMDNHKKAFGKSFQRIIERNKYLKW